MFESKPTGSEKEFTIVTNAMISLGNNKTYSAKEYFEGLVNGITSDDWKNGFLPK